MTDSEPTLEELRRARGEGWDWPRIASEACPQCGMDAAALPRDSLGPRLVEEAVGWREVLVGTDPTQLRAIPAPGVFSPLQYGAHVRDIARVYTERVERAVAEPVPTFEQHNPPSEVFERYNDLDPAELADDLEQQSAALAVVLAALGDDEWERTLVRDGGQDGVHTFTVHGQACYALHESHHHLLDAIGQLQGSPR